ncbi:glyoxylate/hydroxypyruvate reductase A [Porifericola rhodea]|uniref:2-hydroxyacid dehydrogenase n=1 Tax=Porifericola rhodea TaxID=930972 RepID=UPI002665899B|nr:glyoxylate/hydroxypyruvate reductase A [Porifericola rhodea]WKN30952.1 glyoxylate/hydroxypyruvate reductase A [Porifericola rhodea]
MKIALILPDRPTEVWKDSLLKIDPQLQVDVFPNLKEYHEYSTAIVWKHPVGLLNKFPNLKLICSLGAGVDHILRDPQLPNVPITRVVDSSLTTAMSNYVIMGVLNNQRQMYRIWENQKIKRWEKVQPNVNSKNIGILGLGELGKDAALKLHHLGFRVHAYAQSPKKIEGISTYSGEDGLAQMLKAVHVVVCLLPLTSKTKNLLDTKFFALLNKGTYLINVARGELIVENNLLTALGNGTLSGALLDVFREDPLPDTHPFWSAPGVQISPHIASITNPETAARQMVFNHYCAIKGDRLTHQIDPHKEY